MPQPYTEDQPIEGETVLLCVHLTARHRKGLPTGKADFFRSPDGVGFTRPDGSSATATWIAVCNSICFDGNEEFDIDSAVIGGDCVWQGNAPSLRVPDD